MNYTVLLVLPVNYSTYLSFLFYFVHQFITKFNTQFYVSSIYSKITLQRPNYVLDFIEVTSITSFKMPPSQDAILQQARTAFRAVAGNLTSTLIDVESLRTAICVTGRNPSIKQCEDAWETAKAGEDVDFTEFCEIISELPRPSKKDLIAAFQALDTNGDGSLDVEEFTRLLCTQGSEKMAKQEVNSIFRQADANEDGRLDYQEFVGMMMSTIQNCDKLEVETKVPQKMVKSIEIESPEVSPRSSLYPGNGVKSSNSSKPPRNGRKSRNTEMLSDYDTELVFSDLDQAPQNPNDDVLMLTNLTSQNSALNNSTLNSTTAKKQGFFSSIFNKSNPDLSKNPPLSQKIHLPYDLVQIRQAAFAQKSVQKMPTKSPWIRQQLFNTLIMPSFNGLSQTIPLCIVAPSTTEIAISVTSSSTQNLQKITGLLLSDQNPAAPYQEPIAFTFQKTADANKFMLKTDIRAGTYKFLVFSTDFKKPVISRDASLIGNGKFLSNQAKAALVEVFKMFDLDGDGFLNRQEYGIFHRITCEDQVLKNEEWNDIVSKVVVNKNRITRDAFLALHQGYLQQDPQIVLESLIECGVDADTVR